MFDDTNKAVREVTLLFPSQLYIATSGIPNSGKGMWVSTTVPKGALICEFTGTLVFGQDTPAGKRRDFPPSKILADPHTWRLLGQKEWDPPVAGDPKVDDTWFVLAITAKDEGSGAGFVNSVVVFRCTNRFADVAHFAPPIGTPIGTPFHDSLFLPLLLYCMYLW